MTSKKWTNIEKLTSDHINADTKILLYIKYATILHNNVFISIQETGKCVTTSGKVTEKAAHIHMLNDTRGNRQITDLNVLTENVTASLNMTDYSKEKFLSTWSVFTALQLSIPLTHFLKK